MTAVRWQGNRSVTEETFEMLGEILVVVALLMHFRSRGYRVSLETG